MATTTASAQAPASVDGLVEEAAPAPVAAPSLFEGVGPSRGSTSKMRSLEDVTFTLESLERLEVQDLLIKTLETFLGDTTKPFPIKSSKAEPDGPRNEIRWVEEFLGVSPRGNKVAKAVALLRAACKKRGVTSEYFNEQGAAST